MKLTWRWFGPADTISIDEILQSDAEGIVSALHHLPTGEVWSANAIAERVQQIATTRGNRASGLKWDVVESLPVSEDIKKQSGDWRAHIDNYRQSLRNLAAHDIRVVCYNFMPVLDWTRTDLAWRLPHGGTTMRFDLVDFAAFDLFLLERPGAGESFPGEVRDAAERRLGSMTDDDRRRLVDNVACGLPGAAESLSVEGIREHLAEYDGIDADRLRGNFIDFLSEVSPLAEELGVRLCCHPDDPPFPLLGLPRIMSTEADYAKVLDAVDTPANGMTLCAGSLGARSDNDLPGMVDRLGSRIHFLHLRNVRREASGTPTSFYETEHLNGDNDMVAMVAAILREEHRRRQAGRDDCSIPIRPDHGLNILDDLGKDGQPGYPLIGRLKGLAELHGIALALGHPEHGLGLHVDAPGLVS